jgi:hypothetical protein
VGRTLRATLVAVVVAAAATGCGSTPEDAEAEALADAADIAMEYTEFCKAVVANAAANEPLSTFAAQGGAPHPAEAVSAVVEPVRASNADLLDKAPQEVRADAEAMAEVAELRLAAFERSGGDPAVADQDPAYLAKVGEVQPQIDKLQAFFRTSCRVDAG